MEENRYYTKVGETFTYNGKIYRVEEYTGCKGCAFNSDKICYKGFTLCCSPFRRADNKSVIFKEVKTMTKNDLKPGMVVEYANGERRLVLPKKNGNLFLSGTDWWCSLDPYKNDLTHESEIDRNIQKIYSINFGFTVTSLLDKNQTNLTLLWERPEEKVELTLEEIAKKFNIPVESLRIKD